MRRRFMQRWCTVIACLALAAVMWPPASAEAGEVEDWQRHPLMTATYLDEAPTIDGEVNRAEWQAAGVAGPLLVQPEGVADELRRRVWVGYDDEHVYFAWDIQRPEHVREPLVPGDTGRVDSWGAGDFIELMLDTNHDHAEYYDFAVYANGAYADGHGNPSVERGWNTEWTQGARQTDHGWQGEAAIPFASLGLDGAPEPGAVWGLDFVDNQRTPFAQVALYGFRGPGWHKFENFGHLRFGEREPRDPAVRFLRAEEAGRGEVVVEFGVVNGGAASAEVETKLTLLRRKDGVAGGPKSYYDHIESGGDDAYDAGEVDFEKTTTLEGLIEDALTFYEPVEDAAIEQTVQVPGGQRRSVGFTHAVEAGEFLVRYEFRRPDGEALAAGVRAFRISAPLSLTLEPYWLHQQTLDVTADLRKVEVADGGRVIFSIHPREGGSEALDEAEASVAAGDTQAGATLSTAALDAGFYQVQVKLMDSDGQTRAQHREAVEKPEPPEWHNNDYGKRVKVPEPWTPLVAHEDGRVEVWGRTYDLSTLLPKQITSQGDELLTSPATLALTHDGAPVEWEVTSLTLESSDEGHAVYRGELDSAVATVRGTVTIEFDGFAWYDLELEPKDAPLRVDHMALALDFTPAHAELMDWHKLLRDPVLSREALKPAKRGPPGVLSESLLPFTPTLWIGDETGGLSWIAEAPIDWHITEPDRVLEVQPPSGSEDDPARMRIHMIQDAATLDQPMRLQFGLQASPARPMPAIDAAHVVQSGGPVANAEWYEAISEHGGAGAIFHSGWRGSPKTEVWGGWPAHPPTAERRERLTEAVTNAHKHDMKVSLYTAWGVDTDSEEWKHFRHEMARKPLENAGFGTYRQSAGLQGAYIDFMAWSIAELIKSYDIDGVFYDSASNLREDTNIGIGNGWIDRQGRVRPGFAVRGTRELFKRIYTLVHGEMKSGGQIINFGGSIWSINIFADVFHRGEGTPMHVDKLRNAWKPLEVYRANYDGRKFGLASLAMNKNFKNLPMTVNTHHAVTLLHGWHTKSNAYFTKEWGRNRMGYGRDHQPIYKIWQARTWLPLDGDAAHHTFFTDGPEFIQLAPESLLSSAFVSSDGRRMLLVVSNLDDEPVEDATVQLDLTGLGLQGGAPVRVEDVILEQPVEMRDGVLTLDIEPERYRFLKLWRAEQ